MVRNCEGADGIAAELCSAESESVKRHRYTYMGECPHLAWFALARANTLFFLTYNCFVCLVETLPILRCMRNMQFRHGTKTYCDSRCTQSRKDTSTTAYILPARQRSHACPAPALAAPFGNHESPRGVLHWVHPSSEWGLPHCCVDTISTETNVST